MMKLLKVAQSKLDSLARLVLTLKGAKAAYTAEDYSPFGTDSRPPEGFIALYGRTEADGDEFVIGYLNKSRLAEVGEHRIFSTDSSGNFKMNVWLRSADILIGNSRNPADYTNFAVLFNELKTEFNKLKDDHNDLVQKWNSFCGSYAPGSPTTLGTPPTLSTSTVSPNTSNIDNAKNSILKLKS